ncbi:hypothetical protein HDG69_003212 [Isoptericola halotolerans]|uniref:Uncharacterized protein n=1 Tax=Isoptericola halotolerans TaxID=300560 RepID=A0ABX2A6Y1_9MICO|nr:hypothetical protein [Isoptericola halotolerans]
MTTRSVGIRGLQRARSVGWAERGEDLGGAL